ncbi:MAG: Fe-S cluster assembly protein SufD [Halobacteria archaeon]|nr:Fe-S cluster assembly protein SufD [Halobacteria archaeon]
MNTATESRAWFEELLQQGNVAAATEPHPWLNKVREDAIAAVGDLPLPGRKQEEWRYTSIEGLLEHKFEPVSTEFDALQIQDIDDWLLQDTQTYRIVFANGRFVPALRNFDALPDGVTIGSLRHALSHDPQALAIWFGQTANHSEHIFTALNTALISDGLFVRVSRDTVLERPIEVIHLNLGLDVPQLIQPRNLLVLERGANAQLIEHYVSTGDAVYFHNGVSEILLEDNAALTHYRLQQESPQAYHMHQSFLAQAAHSQYRNTSLSLGGKWASHNLEVRFQDKGAYCDTNGLYLVGDKQLIDHHLDVIHATPHNTSRHNYKGILYNKGRAVFDGRILVEKNAQKTDAHLSNKNLLLSRNAEVDTKPQLEIYADDVKCSHGTTVGQLEPEQLFYLRSRGINETAAMKMLCIGFAGEILETIDLPAVRDHAERNLHDILNNVADRLNEQQDD